MRLWKAVSAVVVMLVALAAPAVAQEAVNLAEVGDGRCAPDPVAPGATTDCAFDLARSAPVDPDGGPYVLEFGSSGRSQPPHCHVKADQLRCPDVRVGAPGPDAGPTRSATLAFGDQRRQQAVTVEVVEPSRHGRLRIADHAVVTPGVPLRYATPEGLAGGTWLQVTRRYGTEVVATLEVEDSGGWDEDPIEVPADRLGLEAGSYRLRPCHGSTEEGCQQSGRSTTLQVIDQPLEPLVVGHNRASADRINLVVAGYGFDSERAFTDIATMALDPTDADPLLTDEDGVRLDPDGARQAVEAGQRVEVNFGLFAIGPFDEHVDRFNLWLLPDQLDDPDSLRHPGAGDAPPWVDGFAVDGYQLANVSVVTLAQDPPGADPGSHAATNPLHEVQGPVERDGNGEVAFSGSTTWLGRDAPQRDVTTVAHELGHALFGLRDEYREPSSPVPHYGYPNCAQSRDQAEQWWGDMVGELDPMAERYRQVVEIYQPLRDISDDLLAQWAEVGIHEHPCASATDAPPSFVPTQRGLMSHELPILGSVNRARAGQILGLFSDTPRDGATTQPSPDPTPSPTVTKTIIPSPSPYDETTAGPTSTTSPTAAPTPSTARDDEAQGSTRGTASQVTTAALLIAAVGLWLWKSQRKQ